MTSFHLTHSARGSSWDIFCSPAAGPRSCSALSAQGMAGSLSCLACCGPGKKRVAKGIGAPALAQGRPTAEQAVHPIHRSDLMFAVVQMSPQLSLGKSAPLSPPATPNGLIKSHSGMFQQAGPPVPGVDLLTPA